MLKPMSSITICILTLNRLRFLKQTLDSVVKNNYRDYNLIVLDDNSEDGTYKYLSGFSKNNFKIIRHNRNYGQYQNANYVLDNIESEYLLFLHDDDMIEPNYLENVMKFAESNKDAALIGTGWRTIDENNTVLEEMAYKKFSDPILLSDKEYFYNYVQGLNFPWSGTAIKKEKIKKVRFRDAQFPYGADAVFLSELAIGNKVGYIPDILVNYRIHKAQIYNSANFEQNYKRWIDTCNFNAELIKSNNYGKTTLKLHKKTTTKTMSVLLYKSPDIKSFFKVLKAGHIDFSSLRIRDWLRIIYKLIKIILKVRPE